MNERRRYFMKRHNHSVFEVAQRIILNFFNEENEEEKKEFQQLIHESGLLNNASDLEDRERIATWLKEPARFSSRKAYRKFENYVRQKHRRMQMHRLMRVAAFLVLPLLVGGFAWWLFSGEGQKQEVLVAETVQPITSKAYITLDDGRKVILGEDTGEMIVRDGTRIIRDSAKVVYATADVSGAHETVYHDLNVPRGGEYMLVLSDSTRVWVNADSKLRYPVYFDGDTREVSLLEGEAYFEVTKNREKPFLVHTSQGTVKVLGTEFNVRNYADEAEVVTTLVNGSVQFVDNRNRNKNKSVILKPGYQVVADSTAKDWIVQQVNLKEFVGWRDGLYVFNRLTLEELMRTVERNYDVTVFFANEECKALRFSGDLRKYENVEHFLRYIETGGDVHFVVKDRTITVYKK